MKDFETVITGTCQADLKDWQNELSQVRPAPSPCGVSFAVSDAYCKAQP